jgi:hypothetical protein
MSPGRLHGWKEKSHCFKHDDQEKTKITRFSSMNERWTYHRAFVPNATVRRRNNSRHVSDHPGEPQLGK